MRNIAVMVSGGGTNLQALIDAEKAGKIPHGKITLVVASNDSAYALKRAENNGIEAVVVKRKAYEKQDAFDKAIVETLHAHNIDMVVLAGYLSILGETVIQAYRDRIINIHPSLIPSFCGTGYYGLRVHEGVLARGVKVTGATVHFVNEIPDGGRILKQKAVYIEDGDTAETLQRRVMEQAEWILLPEACEDIAKQLDEGENK